MIKKLAVIAGLVMSISMVSAAEPIVTDSTTSSTVTTNGSTETTVKSPPASAISPNINTSNSDLCTVGVAGAVQTQILGISAGSTVRDLNCERLKLSKTLYDMCMKVAAVSTLCQDERIFNAMMQAGTPCPYDGMIGEEAKLAWEQNKDQQPSVAKEELDKDDKTFFGGLGLSSLLLILLL